MIRFSAPLVGLLASAALGLSAASAASVFSDDFLYGEDGAFIDEGGWTTVNGLSVGALTGFTVGKSGYVEYNHGVALLAGDVITMDGVVDRYSTSGNGYAYIMEIFLWDGVNDGTRQSVAGGTQQGVAANLTQVSYTAGASDAGKQIVFRFGHDGPGTGAGDGWGQATSVDFGVNTVPEPSSAVLVGLAGLALLLRRRR